MFGRGSGWILGKNSYPKDWNGLPKELIESPSLEMFKKLGVVVLRNCAILVVGEQLDWMILDVFSNLGDSVICLWLVSKFHVQYNDKQ